MPGLTLVCDLVSPLDAHVISGYEAGSSGETPPSVIWRDPNLVLLSAGYPEYPITIHDGPEHLICVEGSIYQAPESPWYRSLSAIAGSILSGDSGALARAARWIAEIDGDFVIAFQDRRSRDVVILNDFLGRLPLYIRVVDGTGVVVSRDLSVLLKATRTATVDRLAAAEHLLYGYPLGTRTLFSGVERVTGGSLIQVRRQAQQILLSTLLTPSVTPEPGLTSEKLKDTARDLSSKFARACAARAGGALGTTLGLSGGLDSRSVAAALSANHLSFTAVTQTTGPGDAESRIAGKVASVLQLNWRTIAPPRPTGMDLLRLLKMKSGMNYLGMAHILPFLDSLQTEFGRGVVFMTGDGGDKILPDLRPRIRITERQSLLRHLLANNEVFSLPTVVAITGVPRGDILAALEARISSYPEDDFEGKYIHFELFERGFKWLFEGEDRNRHFFWSTTPFYGQEPFIRAMRCPPQLKTDYALYRHFMESLNPKLVDLESTTCGPSLRLEHHSIDQRLLRELRYWIRERIPLPVRRSWRAVKRRPVGGEAMSCIREQLGNASPVADFLSPSHANAVLERLGPLQIYMLLTLTAVIEYFTTGRSTLERYRDCYF